MNHIAQTLQSKLSSVCKLPTCDRILSSENVASPTITHCDSWKCRMFAKVKECRDAIRNMINFAKSPNRIEDAAPDNVDTNDRPNFSSAASGSVTSSNDTRSNRRVLVRKSALKSNEIEDLSALIEKIDDTNNANNSLIECLDNTMSSSLKSFLTLEKQIMKEYLEEGTAIAEAIAICSDKKKISAEPFLSYAQGSPKFIWSEDTEDSVSGKHWNSLEHFNSSDIAFENSRANSTFCEYSYRNNRCSSPIRRLALQDSGFETNFSI